MHAMATTTVPSPPPPLPPPASAARAPPAVPHMSQPLATSARPPCRYVAPHIPPPVRGLRRHPIPSVGTRSHRPALVDDEAGARWHCCCHHRRIPFACSCVRLYRLHLRSQPATVHGLRCPWKPSVGSVVNEKVGPPSYINPNLQNPTSCLFVISLPTQSQVYQAAVDNEGAATSEEGTKSHPNLTPPSRVLSNSFITYYCVQYISQEGQIYRSLPVYLIYLIVNVSYTHLVQKLN
jgi:hypothetical protein